MDDELELEALLNLDGARYEFAEGYVVEFKAERTDVTEQRPHGVSYALVLRPKGKDPLVRFDNAHGVERPGARYERKRRAYDHWHRSKHDKGSLTSSRRASSCLKISGRK
jgi:hypothetical protein